MADQLDGSQIGTLSAALTASATTMTSDQLRDLRRLPHAGGDVIRIVIDPTGNPEIVLITAHTSGSKEATITRAQEGTTARSHSKGKTWQMSITGGSLTGSNMDGTRMVKEGSVGASRIKAGTLTIDRFEVAPLNHRKGLQYATDGSIKAVPLFGLGGVNTATLLMTLSVGGDRGVSGDIDGNNFDGIIPFQLMERWRSRNVSRSTYCSATANDVAMPSDLSGYHSILVVTTSRIRAPNLDTIREIDHHTLIPIDEWGHGQSSDNSLPFTTRSGLHSPFDAQLTEPPKRGHMLRCYSQLHKGNTIWTSQGRDNSIQSTGGPPGFMFAKNYTDYFTFTNPPNRLWWQATNSTWADNHREFVTWFPNDYAITDHNSIQNIKSRVNLPQRAGINRRQSIDYPTILSQPLSRGQTHYGVMAGRGDNYGGDGDWWAVGSTSAPFTGNWPSGGKYVMWYPGWRTTPRQTRSDADITTLSSDLAVDSPLVSLSPTFAMLFATSRTTWRLAFPDTAISWGGRGRLMNIWSTLRLWELIVKVYGVGEQ